MNMLTIITNGLGKMTSDGRRRIRQWTIIGGSLVATLVLAAATTGQEVPTTQPQAAQKSPPTTGGANLVSDGLGDNGGLHLMTNRSAVINTIEPYKRVSVGNPEVADVNPIGPSNILVTAKQPGSTQLIIWDDEDRSQVIDVLVESDLQALKSQFDTLFPDHEVELSSVQGTIVLRGRVGSIEIAEQMEAVALSYGKALNLLEVSGGKQVMLQVRFAEVSRSATTQLGVNFAFTDGSTIIGNNIGQVSPFGFDSIDDALVLGVPNPSASVTIFGRATNDGNAFHYFISALRQNNLMRILAEPNLTAISGQEAEFLAGGEFPVPVTQDGGNGGSAITIEYREFGVRLTFLPVVLGDGRIRLAVTPEVSDLDFSTAVRLSGFVVPGLTSRRMHTVIELTEGQSFAIAGLLNNTVAATKDATPVLGDIPVVGALFRSVRYQRKETELVVLVTPHIVEPMNPEQVTTLPGEHWRHPTEADLFWQRDIGGEYTPATDMPDSATTQPVADGPAPRFRGQYGFAPATRPTAESVVSTNDE